MELTLGDAVLYSENGKTVSGDVLDIRGDYYVVHNEAGESVVSKSRIISNEPVEEQPSFAEGGQVISVKENKSADLVNSMEFYRYYPVAEEPFKISYDASNKYGFGIYFLDDFDFYKDKFDNARFLTIKPKVKSPLILTYHKRMTPSFEYQALLDSLIKKGDVKDKDELTKTLIRSGFDSLVVYEPRGIFLILLKEDDSLYEVISDLGVTQISLKKDGGYVSPEKIDSEVIDEISKVVSSEYSDITEYQGEILYRNFNDDLDGFFVPANSDTEIVLDLSSKGYVQRDYEIVGDAYILTEKGKEFVSDVVNNHL